MLHATCSARLCALAQLTREDRGQMGITFVLSLMAIFMFFTLAVDVGMWSFDHRRAQNQAEAAALAAIQHLPDPANDTTAAAAGVDIWLTLNGSTPADLMAGSPEFSDLWQNDGRYDTVRVCLRRQAAALFGQLASIPFAYVSACATATVGPAEAANVMPWGIVPPDPTCNNPGQACQDVDTNGDGLLDDLDTTCGYYPPVPPGGAFCPWGLNPDRLYTFKVSGTLTPGNFGSLSACGTGVSNYRDCINGAANSGFWAAGQTVNVETAPGSGGANTNAALTDKYDSSSWPTCDVEATPNPASTPAGLDPDGKATAEDRFVVGPTAAVCADRLVIVPVIDAFPPQGASADILVLGIATFGIAKWDRSAQGGGWGDALGTATDACGVASVSSFECGMVWGYLMLGARPPDALLQRIGNTSNPFAPLMAVLIE